MFNPERVRTIHLSHCCIENYDMPYANEDDVDLHTPCSILDYKRLLEALDRFPNVEEVISEIAYSADESGKRVPKASNEYPISPRDYVRDALALTVAVRTGSLEKVREVLTGGQGYATNLGYQEDYER